METPIPLGTSECLLVLAEPPAVPIREHAAALLRCKRTEGLGAQTGARCRAELQPERYSDGIGCVRRKRRNGKIVLCRAGLWYRSKCVDDRQRRTAATRGERY